MTISKISTRKFALANPRLLRLTLALSVIVFMFSYSVLERVSAAQGGLDTTFGNAGKVITSFTGPADAEDVAIQTDGKIVAVGFARDFEGGVESFAVVRYDTSGALDLAFGSGGKVVTDLNGCPADARAVVIQANNKIIAAGTNCVGSSASDFGLVRYNSDGTLDPAFGIGGVVTTDLSGQADELNDIAIDANGRIVAVGKAGNDFAIVRYNSDGSLDGSFGAGGIVTTNFGGMLASEAKAVVLQPDTRIVAAGTAGGNIALARYNSDGSLDSANFGTGGIVIASFPSSGNGVAIQGTDKILVAGRVDGFYGVARFNGDGSNDTAFGTNGRVNVGLDGEANDVAVQSDNKIITCGFAHDAMKNDEFALARFNSFGGRDLRFGINGTVITAFTNLVDRANGLAIQSDGKIVVAGIINAGGSPDSDFALARYETQSPVLTGTDTVGLYDPAASQFFLKNSNTAGLADLVFVYGPAGSGWIPITGDWNGDAVDTVGLFDPAASRFFLRNSNTAGIADLVFVYGPAGSGWIPIVGDWDGDGVDTIGLFDPATNTFFLRNSNTAGIADLVFIYGPGGAGWIPIVGDWDGDGVDTVGLFDPVNNRYFLKNTNAAGPADLVFVYGPFGAIPLAGDYNNDGVDTIGQFNPPTNQFFLKNSNTTGSADLIFQYGPPASGWKPLIGNWNGQ